MLRRAAVAGVVALLVCGAVLGWLGDGDPDRAIEPVRTAAREAVQVVRGR